MRSFRNQPAPVASVFTVAGSPVSASLTSTTSPLRGALTSLAALTDSTTAASANWSIARPTSGSST